MALTHKGDKEFGDISCNYTYSRKITIKNGGSIPSDLSSYWLIVGLSSEQPQSSLKLGDVYTFTDPRSQWARHQLISERKGLTKDSGLNAKDYWKLILYMIRKDANHPQTLEHATDFKSTLINKRIFGTAASTHFKRRQVFYHLIHSTRMWLKIRTL